MPVAAILGFWGLSFLLVLSPGADWAYLITAGTRHRSVLPAVAGLLVGYLLLVTVVAGGVATVVAGAPLLLHVLTVAGAGYLIWLGLAGLVGPGAPTAGPAAGAASSWARQAAKGAAVSGLNPKALLLFLAVLPQFVDPYAGWPAAAQILVLGLVHILSCAVVYLAVGAGARRVLATRPTWARALSRWSAGILIGIGTLLLAEQILA